MSAHLANDLALALDPALMLQRMGLDADPWQVDFLRSVAKRVLVNIHRQAGKSTVVGALAAHTATFQENSLILLLSPSLRQSQELFKKTLAAYDAIGGKVKGDAETKLTLELANGSRVVSLPGTEGTVRGFSGARLLLIDEASRVLDSLYMSVRPMLAVSGGRLIAPSTPNGKRGWWFTEWHSDSAWERFKVPASQCARISPEFLEEELKSLGPYWYAQEYGCEFGETVDQLFSHEVVTAALTDTVSPLFGIGSVGGGGLQI